SSGSSSRSSSSRSVSSRSSHSSSSKSSGYRRRYRRDRGDSPRDRRAAPPPSSSKKRGPSPIPQTAASFTRLYIGRLTRNVNRDHLYEIFSAFGKVLNVDLPMDRLHSHLNRGFSYVEFENPDDAAKAVKYMDGGQIDGQEISASKIDLTKMRSHIPNRGSGGRNPGWRPNSSPPNRGERRRRNSPPPSSRRRSRSRTPPPPPIPAPARGSRRRRSSRSSSASSR
ncbi:RNA-binding protein with serine-rich domain 1-A-like protein, partial [Euroglyphus maynei]